MSLKDILSNHFVECGRCGRKYNNGNEMYSSKNGCPRKCRYPDRTGWNVYCKSCDAKNNCHNTHCISCKKPLIEVVS